jgi:hypothetical protein
MHVARPGQRRHMGCKSGMACFHVVSPLVLPARPQKYRLYLKRVEGVQCGPNGSKHGHRGGHRPSFDGGAGPAAAAAASGMPAYGVGPLAAQQQQQQQQQIPQTAAQAIQPKQQQQQHPMGPVLPMHSMQQVRLGASRFERLFALNRNAAVAFSLRVLSGCGAWLCLGWFWSGWGWLSAWVCRIGLH